MKKLIVLILSAVMALTMGGLTFAGEAEEAAETAPVIGSWTLTEVYQSAEDQEPVLLKKEEAQSVYGSGISIYTIFEDGSAAVAVFDGTDMADLTAEWTSPEPGIIEVTGEAGDTTFCYNAEEDTLHRYFMDEAVDATYSELDFVYSRAIVGAWKLDNVKAIHEGDAPEEIPAEGNQSLYGNAENVYVFCADGTLQEIVADGADSFIAEATWEMVNPDEYLCTSEYGEHTFFYSRVDDAFCEDIITEDEDAQYPFLRFTYTRTEYTPEAE